MQRHFCGCRLVVLQHVLDEVDSSARRVQFIAELKIGRASSEAEPAMHAPPQDRVGLLDVRVGKLGQGKRRLHQLPATIRPGLSIPRGSNCSFNRFDRAAKASGCGSKGGTALRNTGEPRTKFAWPPPDTATARRISCASPSRSSPSTSIHTSPP